jgi:hypothetical protein
MRLIVQMSKDEKEAITQIQWEGKSKRTIFFKKKLQKKTTTTTTQQYRKNNFIQKYEGACFRELPCLLFHASSELLIAEEPLASSFANSNSNKQKRRQKQQQQQQQKQKQQKQQQQQQQQKRPTPFIIRVL